MWFGTFVVTALSDHGESSRLPSPGAACERARAADIKGGVVVLTTSVGGRQTQRREALSIRPLNASEHICYHFSWTPPPPRGRGDSTRRLQKAAQIGTLPQFCVITAPCLLYIKLPLVSICIYILMTSCFNIMSKQINKVHVVQKQVCFAVHGLQEATFTRHATLHGLFTREEEIKIYE